MLPSIPTTEPTTVTAGDTLSWQIALPDYPATDGWVLKYRLVGAAAVIAIVSAASGSDHLVSVTAVASAGYAAGRYQAVKYVEKGSDASLERVTIGSFELVVNPNLAAATAATDTRSHARKVLDAIEAVIEGRASVDQQEVMVDTGGGRQSLKRCTIKELLELRQTYRTEVQAENDAKTGQSSRPRYFMRL